MHLAMNCEPLLCVYCSTRAYILENIPPGGDISQCLLGEKICKGEEKKGENVKEKEEKGKKGGKGEKMRKGEVK
jgi:hypothetical protein